MGITALVGNSVALYLRAFRGHGRVQQRLIASLAVADLMMGIYMLIIGFADLLFGSNYFLKAPQWHNSGICKMASFLAFLSSEASVISLCLITLDRLICITFPLASGENDYLLRIVVAKTDQWEAEYVVKFVLVNREKRPARIYSIFVFIGVNFAAFIFIAVCYIIMFVRVRQSSLRTTNNTASWSREIKMARRMFILIGTDFACWMPIILMGILNQTKTVEIPASLCAWLVIFILPINSSLNPFLYTLMYNRSIINSARVRHVARDPNQTILPHRITADISDTDPIVDQHKSDSSDCDPLRFSWWPEAINFASNE
ncbi:relaxin receptor 1-like [Diadema setosum]|uniref:relaxin receptor 1-like n=1 Tax=Diadema setosum TaxID=31175 RepID=UPI003B3B2D77